MISSIKNHSLGTGIEYINYNIAPDELNPRGEQSNVISETVTKDNGHELGLYINDEYILNYLISFSFGLRFNAFQQIGPGTVYQYEEGLPKTPETIMG